LGILKNEFIKDFVRHLCWVSFETRWHNLEQIYQKRCLLCASLVVVQ
jgi:hypothetical protein